MVLTINRIPTVSIKRQKLEDQHAATQEGQQRYEKEQKETVERLQQVQEDNASLRGELERFRTGKEGHEECRKKRRFLKQENQNLTRKNESLQRLLLDAGKTICELKQEEKKRKREEVTPETRQEEEENEKGEVEEEAHNKRQKLEPQQQEVVEPEKEKQETKKEEVEQVVVAPAPVAQEPAKPQLSDSKQQDEDLLLSAVALREENKKLEGLLLLKETTKRMLMERMTEMKKKLTEKEDELDDLVNKAGIREEEHLELVDNMKHQIQVLQQALAYKEESTRIALQEKDTVSLPSPPSLPPNKLSPVVTN